MQWDPLHEPDHFIDVRKLLASPSRRRTAPHRHQLRSSTLPPKRSTAAIVPPASGRSGRTSTSSQRPDAEGQALLGAKALDQLRGHWGAMKAQ